MYDVLDYYDMNMPKGICRPVKWEHWTAALSPTITIQPAADMCNFVYKVVFTATDALTFAAGAGPKITTTGWGADSLKVENLLDLISIGDPELYKEIDNVGGAAVHHQITLTFKPPHYLRSSPPVNESFVVELDGGAITAGTLNVAVHYCEDLEVNSGLV